MLVHVVNSSGHVLPVEQVLVAMDRGYLELTQGQHAFAIHNVYVSNIVNFLGGIVVIAKLGE